MPDRDPDNWSDFLDEIYGKKSTTNGTFNGNGTTAPILNGGPIDSTSRDRNYALAGLQREATALASMPPDSGRNNALNNAIFSLAGFVPQTLSEEEVVDTLGTAALTAGLPLGEAQATIRSALRGSKTKGIVRSAPPREEPADWFAAVAASAAGARVGAQTVEGPGAMLDNGGSDAGVGDDDSSGALGLEKVEGDFWSSRESLSLIYDSALSRLASPWAVFAFCIARALTVVSPRWTLPPLIGGRGSLNWFAALAARSGGGKGSAHQVARELIPAPVFERNLGSGEGMLAAFERPRSPEDPEGGLREAVMFISEEVDQMATLGGRSGSTLMPTLRSAFSGEALGFTYVKKTPNLAAHSYRLTYVCGVQPARAAGLLSDAAGGTPQRFMWFPALDRRISREYLRPDPWLPTLNLPRTTELMYDRQIKIPQEAADFIIDARVEAGRGDADPMEVHANFAREKLAFGLAIIDGRTEMTLEDWELSGIVAAVSTRTREWVTEHMTEAARGEASERGSLKAVEHVATERAKVIEVQRSVQIYQWVVNKLTEAGEGGMSKRELKDAIRSDNRRYLNGALDIAAKQGVIRYDQSDKRWRV